MEGGKSEKEPLFLLKSLSYKVEFDSAREKAEIYAELEVDSEGTDMLLASIDVDGLELLPSSRIPLSSGLNKLTLPPVRIMRRKLWWPEGSSQGGGSYCIDLKLYRNENQKSVHSREVVVWR